MATMEASRTGRRSSTKYDFKRIVVATDFSSAAEKALQYAIAIAREHGSELTIVHAVAPEPREAVPMDPLPHELDSRFAAAETEMNRLDQRLQSASISHRTILQRGPASAVVSHAIQENRTELLVLGTRARTGITRLVLGSVAEALLRNANCPVLTVGPHAPMEPELPKKLLFATDFRSGSETAFQYAAGIADRYKAKLILLHTIAPVAQLAPTSMEYVAPATTAEAIAQWEDRAREEGLFKLKALVSSLEKPIEAEYAALLDFSPTAILDFTALHKPDLVVMGANRPRSAWLAAHFPWTVLHGVLCGTNCPVLTVSSRGESKRLRSQRATRVRTQPETMLT